MPIVIQCPSCDRRLRVPDNLLGKSVRCPTCQTTFKAAESEEPAPEEPAAEETAPERPARRRPAPPPEDGVEERPSRSRRRPAPADDGEDDQDQDDDRGGDEEDEDDDRPRRRRRGRRGRRRGYGGGAEAASAVTGPAICLMITGGLGIGVAILDLVGRIVGAGALAANGPPVVHPQNPGFDQGFMVGNAIGNGLGMAFDGLGILWGVLVLFGAIKMKSLQNFGLAMTACILAMVPINCCCILGLPFGIWGVTVLNRQDVKEAFG